MASRTVFVADMHLRPGHRPGQSAALWRFVSQVRALGAQRLIFLGDTFNFWFERGGRVVGDYDAVLTAFATLAADGVTMDLVSGNRDFMFGRSAQDSAFYPGFFRGRASANAESRLVRAGVNPRGFNCRFSQDGMLVHCTHGDMYSLRDPGHGMMRWWAMALAPRIGAAWAPFPVLNAAFRILQGRDTLPYRRLLPRATLLEPEVFSPMAAEGVRHVFCGHFHTGYRRLPIPGGRPDAFLHILPCWLNQGAFALFSEGRVEIIGAGR